MKHCPTLNALVSELRLSLDPDKTDLANAISKEIETVYNEGVKHGTVKGGRSTTTPSTTKDWWHSTTSKKWDM